MKQYNKDICILVLSCDAYADLWDDFFNLRDLYWKDPSIRWYLVTESKIYDRNNVTTIHCGKELNWAGRFREALMLVDTPYIGIYLEDYFITDYVDIDRINILVKMMKENNIQYINVSDVFKSIINLPNKEYFADNLIKIPAHQPYGISTESAIWEKAFLLEKLGDTDYSAWQFEIDRCKEALSIEGLKGLILCDEKQVFNVSTTPVVIQGMFYPDAVREFKERGYEINTTHRALMPWKQVLLYKLKVRLANVKFMRKQLKWLASTFLGIKFFT